jgi:hypothetical protein
MCSLIATTLASPMPQMRNNAFEIIPLNRYLLQPPSVDEAKGESACNVIKIEVT